MLADVLDVDLGSDGADLGVLRALWSGNRSPSVWPVQKGAGLNRSVIPGYRAPRNGW